MDHGTFLHKLKLYGFSDNSVNWFSSYLSSRHQVVQVETKFSQQVPLGDYGVPQGSILGPLIFIIYSNDFPACSIEGEAVLYADDNTETVHDKNPGHLLQKIQREATRATEWVLDNKMICAGDKTKLLAIGTTQLKRSKLEGLRKLEIDVCGNKVVETESEKLLGLVVNNTMTWSHYLYGEKWRTADNFPGLISQLSQRVGLLRQVVHLMPKDRFRQIANGLFHSKMVYCLHVFGNVWGMTSNDENTRRFKAFTKNDNKRLQVLQNQVLRMVTGLGPDTPTTTLLHQAKALSVHQLTAFATLTSVHKAIMTKTPKYFIKKLNIKNDSEEHVVPARQATRLVVRADLSMSRGAYFYRAASLWNMLPENLRTGLNPTVFKRKVKEWTRLNIAAKPS